MTQLTPHQIQSGNNVLEQSEDTIDLASYIDLLFDNRWLISAIAALVTVLGTAYTIVATPIYEANILVQVEDSASSSKNIMGDLSSVFDLKTAASAEMEILKSRFVISRAVKNQALDIVVEPKYFPLIGAWIARRNGMLSDPGLFGIGGYVWGTEELDVKKFDISKNLEGQKFVVISTGNDGYKLVFPNGDVATGKVGEAVRKATANGAIEILISKLAGRSGATFNLTRAPMFAAVEKLQGALTIAEKGKQSGIIGVSMEGEDPGKTAEILNEIGAQYIKQNVDRKSEEAEKSLAFLDQQLPIMKSNLEQAEAKYNTLRNSRGTVDLDEEAKSILQQSVISQGRMLELKQKRDELVTRFQESNPIVQAVDRQIATLNAQMSLVEEKIKQMPSVEQDVLRLTRDVKVNTDLYTTLLNSAQQLRLVKASKVGNARLLDVAETALRPVKPKRSIIFAFSVLIGLLLGIIGAFIRKNLFGGINDPHEIEQALGLTVSAAIPYSEKQDGIYSEMGKKPNVVAVLAQLEPRDLAIESLRSFRTSLHFSMLGAKNNVVLFSGPTPGVGKSFISVNFAAVLAATDKRILLIDADLRKGYLQRYFGLNRNNGLSEVIAGEIALNQALHKNVIENVDFLSTGELPPRPAELLGHSRMKELLEIVSTEYDFVIIDTAPVLPVSDALVVAPYAGTIFNVVRGSVSTLGEIEEAVRRFSKAGTSVTGLVFNGLKPRIGRYGYGSKYGKYRYAQYKY